jgi:glycosyltransferase involved in cell wall biosynthesis
VALRTAIARLRDDTTERHDLAERGRARVLALFTQEAVARRTYAVYQEMLAARLASRADVPAMYGALSF